MKILILCGGYGTRLAGAAGEMPKPMIPIGGRPMVWHIMNGFAHWGFSDFVLCLGYRSDLFRQYFLNLSYMLDDVTVNLAAGAPPTFHRPTDAPNWTITFADTGLDSMTACRVKRGGAYVPADDDLFMVTYGDGVCDVDVRTLVAFHRAHGKLATVTAVHPPGRFGELSIGPSGSVRTFNEKPQAESGWISGGFFVFSKQVLDRLSEDPAVMLEREPLQRLAADRQLVAYQHEDFWFCVDTPRDYQQMSEMWQRGKPPWAVWEKPL